MMLLKKQTVNKLDAIRNKYGKRSGHITEEK